MRQIIAVNRLDETLSDALNKSLMNRFIVFLLIDGLAIFGERYNLYCYMFNATATPALPFAPPLPPVPANPPIACGALLRPDPASV
jgi:hypothetical protein